jgi:hypothetical protein
MDNGGLREGDVGLTYTCAICCDVIYEWRSDWLTLTLSSRVSTSIQEYFVHKRCMIGALGDCVPMGEVFE